MRKYKVLITVSIASAVAGIIIWRLGHVTWGAIQIVVSVTIAGVTWEEMQRVKLRSMEEPLRRASIDEFIQKAGLDRASFLEFLDRMGYWKNPEFLDDMRFKGIIYEKINKAKMDEFIQKTGLPRKEFLKFLDKIGYWKNPEVFDEMRFMGILNKKIKEAKEEDSRT